MAAHCERPRLFGHRATIYRLTDYRVVHGWVIAESSQSLTIETQDATQILDGDRFLIEVFATGFRFRMIGAANVIAGTSATFGQVWLAVEQVLDGMRTEGTERQRVRVMEVSLANEIGVLADHVEVIDISRQGLGVLAPIELTVDEMLLMLVLGEHAIEGSVRVRNVRPIEGDEPRWRTGLFIEAMDRLSRSRWMSLIRGDIVDVRAA